MRTIGRSGSRRSIRAAARSAARRCARLEGVSTSVDGAAQFAASREGASVYLPSVPWSARRLVVVDAASQTPLAAPPHAYVTPRLSPDGQRVLLGVADNSEHLWSYDLSAGTLTQLTFEAANRAPIWSPDGQRVIFASNRNGALNLFALPAGGDGTAERLTTTESLQLPGSWSPDGETAGVHGTASVHRARHLAAPAQRRSHGVCQQRSGRKRAALLAGRPMDRVRLERVRPGRGLRAIGERTKACAACRPTAALNRCGAVTAAPSTIVRTES